MTDIAKAVGPKTMIMPVLNGMRHLDALIARFGETPVLGGVCLVASTIDLEGRINACRTMHQGAPALDFESKELLALTVYVARQSKGLPIDISDNPATARFVDAGRSIFERRQGQLNLSCAQCHDDNWGQKLAGATIPQGHPNGYPVYRLEWQGLGSLQRRLRNCLFGMRAETYAYGAPELNELELFLAWRARDLLIETPAVRP